MHTLAQTDLGRAVVLTVVGVLVVASALLLLMLAVLVMRAWLGERKPATDRPTLDAPSPDPVESAPKPVETAGVSAPSEQETLVVVLAAAAAAALGLSPGRVRVLRYTRGSDDWAGAGRRALMTGHRLIPHPPRKPRP